MVISGAIAGAVAGILGPAAYFQWKNHSNRQNRNETRIETAQFPAWFVRAELEELKRAIDQARQEEQDQATKSLYAYVVSEQTSSRFHRIHYEDFQSLLVSWAAEETASNDPFVQKPKLAFLDYAIERLASGRY